MPETIIETTANTPQVATGRLPSSLGTKSFAEALQTLREASTSRPELAPTPSHMPQDELNELPIVFQIRDAVVDERHVSDLMKVLAIHKSVDPIRVWRCGESVLVIDGHHRLEAYRRWNRKAPVPVSFFAGSVEAAIQYAEAANGKLKLQVSYKERANYAWKLVVYAEELGRLSKAQLIERTHISKGTIDTMRKIAGQLGLRAKSITNWDEAHYEWKRGNAEEDRDVDAAWLEAETMKLADRLGRTCGNKLAHRPEITAQAFNHVLGRKAPEIALMMLEAFGFTVTVRDDQGNEVEDLEGFNSREIEVPF